MILHRLCIEDFRGVEREEVHVPSRGVFVIEGPNESGKTSLMDALEMLLEHKASSGRAEIKAASPVGRDVPVVVEADFTIDGERLRYRKEFVRGKRTSLEFTDSAKVALTGDDAHEYVRDLLDRRVDRSLWRALRIAQDEPIGQVDAGKGMESLRRALDTAAGGADPTGDDSLIMRVAEERNRYLTARRGEATGDLARSETRLADARTALDEATAGLSELDAAVTEHARQTAAHAGRRSSLVAVEAEVARLEEAGRTATGLREALRTAEAEVDRATVAHEASSRLHRERAGLVSRRDGEQLRMADLRDAAAQAAARSEPAQTRAMQARTALESAEARVTRARALLDAQREAHECARRRAELEEVDSLLGTLGVLGDELAGMEAELAEVGLPGGAVARIRDAEAALREAVVRSAASAPTVAVAGAGEVLIGSEPVDAAEGWVREIVEDTVFEVGSVSLTVVPAGDTEAVRRAETTARSRLAALLAEVGAGSLSEAEERERRADGLRADIAAHRRRRTDLLRGDTLEDLSRRRSALATEVAADRDDARPAAGDPCDTGVPGAGSSTDPAVESADAESDLARCRGEDRAASSEAETLRTDLATREALAAEAAARVQECEDALAAARADTPDEDLEVALERTRVVVDSTREAVVRARARLDEALADAPPELLENARASLAALVSEERDGAAAVATALGRVNAIGEQGRLGDVAVAEREFEAAQRENEALWRRARAADLLHRTLVQRRAEALRSYQEPFHRAVVELGCLVYGRDFDVRLGEDLTILSRRSGGVTVDYESLSGGAREQLAVIVRIACARLVGDNGVPVFLDDTMGYTDPARRLSMGAVIAAAAATSQVIVLTCDRARFAGVGSARTHIMRSAGASRD
ncbi:AAA family ATPase [Dietzia sp. PP-33]|jgi:DNA repair exonuclease SbcCD ATPase subunit|uniref:AAA family ATPase n=1 Tax=Dietzia sp. PP-33 TaxID=2957500 RepID=UPI0029BA1A20|nr:AAA family ATPase [Dietzia sp. PP-33]MDX2355743.1 AAA family ATPase [Dietzia sp. PP-33]